MTLTGPRQSGKTTLCRAALPQLRYLNLEAPDQRDFAESDPRGFLAQATDGAVIDEIQHVPELLSYIQVDVDERGRNGLYVLTGSEQFRLSRAISQSLAGRTALLRLMPFSMAERARTGASAAVDDLLFAGFYPRILDQRLDPPQALGDYFETYVERDVRRSNEIRNITDFRRFVRLCAGRVGQLVNFTSLADDVGVSHTTARQWLTILEASYVVLLLRPYHANIGKRLIKSPKLYFYDVGLASFLIGIENARQIATHPLRGQLFENAVVMEALKHRLNRGRQPQLWFYRDSSGLECDLLCEIGGGIAAVEAKSGSTLSGDHFASLHKVAGVVPGVASRTVVYGGAGPVQRSGAEAVPLDGLAGVLDRLEVDQEVSEFIRERRGPDPSERDIERLDALYRGHVRPTGDRLLRYCGEIGKGLFRSHEPRLVIERLDGPVAQFDLTNTDRLPEESRWMQFRTALVNVAGFSLNDEVPVRVAYRHRFRGYTGTKGGDFDTSLSVEWHMGLDAVVRSVTVDSTTASSVEATVAYSTLESTPADADRVSAAAVTALLDRIAELSPP